MDDHYKKKKIERLQSEIADVRGKISDEILKKIENKGDTFSDVTPGSLKEKSGLFGPKSTSKVSPVVEEDESPKSSEPVQSPEDRAFELGMEDATNGRPNKAESNPSGLPEDLKSAAFYYINGYELSAKNTQFKKIFESRPAFERKTFMQRLKDMFSRKKGGKTRKHKNKHSKKTMKKKGSKTRKHKKHSKKTMKKKSRK
jgi:hypothetical protein